MGRWYLIAILVATLVITAVMAWRRYTAAQAVVAAGKAIYQGDVPLTARLAGHDADLPAAAVRCANCHSRQAPPAVESARAAAAAPSDSYAAQLSRAALLQMRGRRGGPPSRYDSRSFCRVLREGVDPMNVLVTQTMPRYRLTEQECTALWMYAIEE